MPLCHLTPADKKQQITTIGKDLVSHYGRKRFYSVAEVRASNRRQNIGLDIGCWSHAWFNSRDDFNRHHAELGESCDYIAMKDELAQALSATPTEPGFFDFDLSWLEFPDLSVLNIFDA